MKNSYSKEELYGWYKNKTINPQTKRSIKESGKIYKFLQSEYNRLIFNNDSNDLFDLVGTYDEKLNNKIEKLVGPVFNDLTKSDDEIDIINHSSFWIEENGFKIPNCRNYLVISYHDNQNKIRCFTLESLDGMIKNNIKYHPITKEKIPEHVFENYKKLINILVDNKIINLKKEKEISLKNKAFNVFHKFTLLSIYLEESWFLNLNLIQLMRLKEEINLIFNKSFDWKTLCEINPNGILKKNIINMSLISLQHYILDEIDIILSHNNNNKFLIYCTLLGAMSLVINEIKYRYPDFVFE